MDENMKQLNTFATVTILTERKLVHWAGSAMELKPKPKTIIQILAM